MTDDLEDPPLEPPPPDRVARRAIVMAATTCRAFIESDPANDTLRQRVLQWVESVGAASELEPAERNLLTAPVGRLSERDTIQASWRSEGLVVLSWSLGLSELPAYDDAVDPKDTADTIGFLEPGPIALRQPTLRSSEDLIHCSELHFALHWRLRQFDLDHKPMDFASFAQTAWFGPLTIDQLRLSEFDLALGQVPISRASESDFRRCLSIAMERHQAINWIRGYAEIYSATPTDT